LHFWLLGAALWIWNSELSARLLTVVLGALAVLAFGGFVRRVFEARVAFYSTLMFALFGFHIAYSGTTSSEAPTVFFIVLGLYAWVRFRSEDGWRWLLLSGLAFSAASLCRIEAWLYIPVLTVGLLDFPLGPGAAWPDRKPWGRMIGFTLVASAGATGWMIYSLLKWGDPFAVAKRSAWLSAHLNIHQPLFNRLIAVPGALIVTLTPVIVGLAFLGLARILLRAELLALVPAILFSVLGAAHYFNAVTKNSTMARYTLMYGWLLISYGFEGLRGLSSRWQWSESRKSFAGVLLFVLLWQAGIIAGAHYGPPSIADKLSSVSPTLPLDVELRNLVRWLRTRRTPKDAVIFDDFNYEAINIIRYVGIPSSRSFRVPYLVDAALVERQLADFVARERPRLLVYSPRGQLRSIWSLDDREEINFDKLNMRLRCRWQERDWRVYEIEYFVEGK
jgi:4-amino-4-deoxy-L-arabinose transferase-like glycosyltransferase